MWPKAMGFNFFLGVVQLIIIINSQIEYLEKPQYRK